LFAPIAAAPKLFAVGFLATTVGYGLTAMTAYARTRLATRKNSSTDGTAAATPAKDLNVLNTAVVIGSYLAISSNLRYQLIAGVVEQRVLDKYVRTQSQLLATVGSFAVRSGNTYAGSAMLVWFLKFLSECVIMLPMNSLLQCVRMNDVYMLPYNAITAFQKLIPPCSPTQRCSDEKFLFPLEKDIV
jgi:hypothetical protein